MTKLGIKPDALSPLFILTDTLDFRRMEIDVRGIIQNYRMGIDDLNDYMRDDEGEMKEGWTDILRGTEYPTIDEVLTHDLGVLKARAETAFLSIHTLINHKCEYPSLEEVGDRALICSVCGCNGDV